MNESILVVEDDANIRELVSYTLLKEGYKVAAVSTGEEALGLVTAQPVDLVLLDLMLPGMDGLAVCRKLRESSETAQLPVVILTAKGEEDDIVIGLNAGASDYITKPFSRNVLLARVRAALRSTAAVRDRAQSSSDDEDVIRVHNLAIHLGRHVLLLDGQPIELSATELRILQVLARKPGWVFTREQILDAVHGDCYAITPRAVDVHIVNVRRKLGEAGRYIETVRGVGYRFKD